MAKTKTQFFCSNCGAQSSTWLGKCPHCGEWNTFVEEIVERDTFTGSKQKNSSYHSIPKPIQDISWETEPRTDTRCNELNRVLGGGLVKGSMILVGGEPGIGKSTLMLQVGLHMDGKTILYVSGEESEQQIRMRAERIGIVNKNCLILTETTTQHILKHCEDINPDVVIIDSIQTLTTEDLDSSAGSISQIRETAAELQYFAKTKGIPIFLVGHITKDGNLAGPKILEHMVDTVLHFEGDRNYGYRMLRAVKNRFGSSSELGIFEMQNNGLREVSNPSEILLSQREEKLSGTAIAATIEGLRPILIEVQALAAPSSYSSPQRSTTGFDQRRLSMLLAVLEKRCGFKMSTKDIFLNIAGGIRVEDPAIDLAVIAAILSSVSDLPINPKVAFAAEVGLNGEIRSVNRVEQRIAESNRLGFEKIIVSKYNLKGIDLKKYNIEVIPIYDINNAFSHIQKG